MSKQLELPGTPAPIKPYLTREKAIEILARYPYGDKAHFDPDFLDALQLAIQALHMVENAHHSVSDPRD